MKKWQEADRRAGALGPKQVYFRAHNLLTSAMARRPLNGARLGLRRERCRPANYNWRIVDGIFDTYLERAVRPYVEIGFMPKALSVKPEPYQHHWSPGSKYDEIFTGWAYPPSDYGKWSEIIFQWTKHCVEKIRPRRSRVLVLGGLERSQHWLLAWTAQEFRKLHDFAIDGVRRALPTAKVGGADAARSGVGLRVIF